MVPARSWQEACQAGRSRRSRCQATTHMPRLRFAVLDRQDNDFSSTALAINRIRNTTNSLHVLHMKLCTLKKNQKYIWFIKNIIRIAEDSNISSGSVVQIPDPLTKITSRARD
ncbi:hypothetical protein ACMFMG_010892 [Clarireedia jacksonii]